MYTNRASLTEMHPCSDQEAREGGVWGWHEGGRRLIGQEGNEGRLEVVDGTLSSAVWKSSEDGHMSLCIPRSEGSGYCPAAHSLTKETTDIGSYGRWGTIDTQKANQRYPVLCPTDYPRIW